MTAAKLGTAVDDLVPAVERAWVLSSLEPLVGLVPEDVGLSDRRPELYAGWRIFLESLAERRPLVLVIDDLHWADDGFLDFVDGLVDLVEGVPLLVVASARPELLERRPDWGGGKRNALTVSLGPLPEAETVRLVESLLGRDPADEGLRATVVERSAGNPLYAEEFVRMQTSGGDVSGLPDSVLGIVTARVDLLPPAEKELLRDAAVMGGVVWSDGLRAVSAQDEQTVDTLLRALGRKEFLRRERRSAVLGATEHSFVHTLVRDAVYGQLPRPERVDRHVRVARWIESLPEDRREDRAELLAHHYVEAIQLARSASIDVSDLEPRAAEALREAGLRAFAIGAFPAAVRALRGAAEWMPDGLDARALRALGKALSFTENVGDDELQRAFDRLVAENEITEAAVTAIDLSHVRWRHGDGTAAADWVARALELAAAVEPDHEHAYVMANAARYEMVAGNPDEAIRLADRAIALAEEFVTPRVSAAALVSRATAMANTGAYRTRARRSPARDRLDPGEPVRAHARTREPRLGSSSISARSRRRSRSSERRSSGASEWARSTGLDGSSSATSPRRSSLQVSGTRRRRSWPTVASMPSGPAGSITSRSSSSWWASSGSSATVVWGCGGQRPPRGRPCP